MRGRRAGRVHLRLLCLHLLVLLLRRETARAAAHGHPALRRLLRHGLLFHGCRSGARVQVSLWRGWGGALCRGVWRCEATSGRERFPTTRERALSAPAGRSLLGGQPVRRRHAAPARARRGPAPCCAAPRALARHTAPRRRAPLDGPRPCSEQGRARRRALHSRPTARPVMARTADALAHTAPQATASSSPRHSTARRPLRSGYSSSTSSAPR